MDLEELADLCIRNYKMISFVGAGGKSTLMYALAEKISRRGRKVLVSTTTHIYEPKENFAREEPEIRSLWRAGRYAVVGERTEGGKLRSLPVPRLREYGKRADLILLEADGSRRKPMKVPAEREPVILPECDLVLGVIGLSCLGKPLREVCFRPELACTLFGAELEEIVGEKLAASVLTSEKGTKKEVGTRDYVIVLNQCDTEEERRRAGKIENAVRKAGADQVICTSFDAETGGV